MSDEVAPIIKKVKKVEGHGHHGGAWKVAYADFVTAMMAFFLLMWLLNATSEEQKRGLSNYFGPPGELSGVGGSGGVLSGLTVTSEGILEAQVTSGEGITEGEHHGKKGFVDSEIEDDRDNAKEKLEAQDVLRDGPLDSLTNDVDAERKLADQSKKAKEQGEKTVDALDKKNFTEVKEALKQAILQDMDLRKLSEHLIIDETPEGLRIQIIDRHNQSMFRIGDARPLPGTEKLLLLVGRVINKLPNKISVTGYTDAIPYNRKDYSNWELSADRANAARRVLLRSGLNDARMSYITGKAATDPFIPSDPKDPRNRRISIILHRIIKGV